MKFDYVVGWYSRKENQMKPLGGFLNIKSAKAYADMKDTLFFGEGFLYIDSPEGKYINGYEKYSDNRPKWFTPEEIKTKQIRVFSSQEDRNVLLDEFLPYEEYKRFKENDNLSQKSKQEDVKSSIQEFKVTYFLSDEEVQRLQKITEKLDERIKKNDRHVSSVYQCFNAIMFSPDSVNEVLTDYEILLGLGKHMEKEQEESVNGKSSVLEKLSENKQKVDFSNAYNEHREKEQQNER